jgi:hypothetical protein
MAPMLSFVEPSWVIFVRFLPPDSTDATAKFRPDRTADITVTDVTMSPPGYGRKARTLNAAPRRGRVTKGPHHLCTGSLKRLYLLSSRSDIVVLWKAGARHVGQTLQQVLKMWYCRAVTCYRMLPRILKSP